MFLSSVNLVSAPKCFKVLHEERGRSRGGDISAGARAGPPPYVWRHWRRTGLFVLDLGRGRSAIADKRLKKVKLAFNGFANTTRMDEAKAYTPVGPRRAFRRPTGLYLTLRQWALRQAKHELPSQALHRLGHTRFRNLVVFFRGAFGRLCVRSWPYCYPDALCVVFLLVTVGSASCQGAC